MTANDDGAPPKQPFLSMGDALSVCSARTAQSERALTDQIGRPSGWERLRSMDRTREMQKGKKKRVRKNGLRSDRIGSGRFGPTLIFFFLSAGFVDEERNVSGRQLYHLHRCRRCWRTPAHSSTVSTVVTSTREERPKRPATRYTHAHRRRMETDKMTMMTLIFRWSVKARMAAASSSEMEIQEALDWH